ncbi:MAG: lipid-A-disaccharide synthase [Prevotella sp.]|nr:lipid-A-disaccharide synthase [Prevotella sp.]
MKYYLIAGEASGDLHASKLMAALRDEDPAAQFRYIGGDRMTAVGGERMFHFKDIAYMGFVPVLAHLDVILKARRGCKRDIAAWKPDVVILVDYADFNLNIAKYVKTTTAFTERRPRVYYYISPKIWAWKEGRIKLFRKYVDEMFCILPFEKDFFEGRHRYKVHYTGNPTASEVREFKESEHEDKAAFCRKHALDSRPIVALLAGSRRQEIKDNLPMMARVAERYIGFQFVVAQVESVENEYYERILRGTEIKRVSSATYALLSHADAALVTSGTATLETCCFDVPQVVLYKTLLPRVSRFVWDRFFRVKYISLVNLIADKEVVAEMMAEKFEVSAVCREFEKILPGSPDRSIMLDEYKKVREKLGDTPAHATAAHAMRECLLSAENQ